MSNKEQVIEEMKRYLRHGVGRPRLPPTPKQLEIWIALLEAGG